MGLPMPPDFYELWEFAKSVSPGKPLDCLASVGLKLCGAYEVYILTRDYADWCTLNTAY